MAESKSLSKRTPARPELEALLDRAKDVVMTDEDMLEQQASFVYGNAPKDSGITKESARRSVRRIRLTDAPER